MPSASIFDLRVYGTIRGDIEDQEYCNVEDNCRYRRNSHAFSHVSTTLLRIWSEFLVRSARCSITIFQNHALHFPF